MYKLKFVLLYLLFFDISSNCIDSENGMTICNQFHIRRQDTWLIEQVTIRLAIGHYLPIGNFLEHTLNLQTFFEILASKCIGITSLTFQGHATSRSHGHSIPRWPFPIAALLSSSLYLKPSPRYWALGILGSRPWSFWVTWRHRSRDHGTRNGSFPIGGPLDSSLYL